MGYNQSKVRGRYGDIRYRDRFIKKKSVVGLAFQFFFVCVSWGACVCVFFLFFFCFFFGGAANFNPNKGDRINCNIHEQIVHSHQLLGRQKVSLFLRLPESGLSVGGGGGGGVSVQWF